MTYSDRLRTRFNAKVREGAPDECWIWCAARNRDGYGILAPERRGDPPLRAHRVAFELHFGPIPSGLGVLHRCDNPPCCNPAHLYPGTNIQNVEDKVARGRQARTAHHGSANPAANLNEIIVAEIRRLLAERDDRTTRRIIRTRYQITRSTLYLIRHNKAWRHVDLETAPVTEEPDGA